MMESVKKEIAVNIQLKTTTIRTASHKLLTHTHSTLFEATLAMSSGLPESAATINAL